MVPGESMPHGRYVLLGSIPSLKGWCSFWFESDSHHNFATQAFGGSEVGAGQVCCNIGRVVKAGFPCIGLPVAAIRPFRQGGLHAYCY